MSDQFEKSSIYFQSKIVEKDSTIKEFQATIEDFEVKKSQFDKKYTEQNNELLDLKYELAKAEDDKDEAVQIALDEQKEQLSILQMENTKIMEQLQKAEHNKEAILEEIRKNDAKSDENLIHEIESLKQKLHRYI